MAAHGAPKKVLVLGGGDGMAVREILKYPSVEQVTLVELDPAMTQLFSTEPMLTRLNGNALTSPKVRIVNTDAFGWLEGHDEVFDVIVVDFPDPTNFALGKLYTTSFYALLDPHLSAGGFAVVQTAGRAYRLDPTLGGAAVLSPAEGAGIDLTDSTPVVFTGVLCHSATLQLTTHAYLDSGE